MALYSKYRPQRFEDIIGQPSVQGLKRALDSGRVSHAYLLTGPRGTGKTTTARLMAKHINCLSLAERPCDECDNCIDISLGNFDDVVELDGASNRGIDQIRSLRDRVIFNPIGGRYKVYIVDEAHMLTPEASNALLKTLEEPPAHAIFILATTEEARILPTILSRCQVVRFSLLGTKLIFNRLLAVAKAEHWSIEPEAIQVLAEEARGALRDGLSLLEMAVSAHANTVSEVRQLLGRASLSQIDRFIMLLGSRDLTACIDFINMLVQTSVSLEAFAQDVINRLRNILFLLSGVPCTDQAIKCLASSFNIKEVIILLDKIAHFDRAAYQLGLELAVCQAFQTMSPKEDY